MAACGNKAGRPTRRHAHICRTCDATFGCKAELLEHEQEEHTKVQNKAVKRKILSGIPGGRKSMTGEDSVERKHSQSDIKNLKLNVVGDISVDHEEIYYDTAMSDGTKDLKKVDQVRPQYLHKESRSQAKSVTASGTKQIQLKRAVEKDKDEQCKQMPTSKVVAQDMLKSKGLLSKHKQAKLKHRAGKFNDYGEIKQDDSGSSTSTRVEEVAGPSIEVEEAENSTHSRHSSINVMTVLGLKPKNTEDENRITNEISQIKSTPSNLISKQDKVELIVSKNAVPQSEVSKNNHSLDDSEMNSLLALSTAVELSTAVDIKVGDSSNTNESSKSEKQKDSSGGPHSASVVESVPSSDMYMDIAECCNEVTVVDTPSAKITKKKKVPTATLR